MMVNTIAVPRRVDEIDDARVLWGEVNIAFTRRGLTPRFGALHGASADLCSRLVPSRHKARDPAKPAGAILSLRRDPSRPTPR
jgi:hypothetical protein